MRNIYSPDVACANELVIDQLAGAMRKDPLAFRLEFLKNERVRAVLRKVAEVGRLGPGDAARHRPGHRDPLGVQGRDGRAGRDRLPARDGEPHGPRRRSRDPGSPRR